MKFRESGMPEESYWDSYFDPIAVLRDLGLKEDSNLVVDIGSGYGTFTFPTAQLIKGNVIGIDIENEMIKICNDKAEKLGIKNVNFLRRDIYAAGLGIENNTVDSLFLFNILHCEFPIELLKISYEALKPNGELYVIHWKYDVTTPRGPSMDIRPKPEQIIRWAKIAEFAPTKQLDIALYHYGLVFIK